MLCCYCNGNYFLTRIANRKENTVIKYRSIFLFTNVTGNTLVVAH